MVTIFILALLVVGALSPFFDDAVAVGDVSAVMIIYVADVVAIGTVAVIVTVGDTLCCC